MSAVDPNAPRPDEPSRSNDTVDRLALAFRAGDGDALLALHGRLAVDVNWLVGRAAYRLPEMPSLEQADLRQDAWLALAEAAQDWDPGRDGPFRRYALRALSRRLARSLRRYRARGAARLGTLPHGWREPLEPVDRAPHADPSRWSDAIIAREVAAALPPDEWQALRGRVVGEQALNDLAADLGVTRRTAAALVRRAHQRAQVLLGTASPPPTPEAEVLAAVRAGVDPWTGRGPTSSWVLAHTGLGRRRLRATLTRLVALGYVRRRGRRWQAKDDEELGIGSQDAGCGI